MNKNTKLIIFFFLFLFSRNVCAQCCLDSLIKLESTDQFNHLIVLRPDPNYYLKNNLKIHFNKAERKLIFKKRVLTLNVVVDVQRQEIVKVYSYDTIDSGEEIVPKICKLLEENLKASTVKIINNKKDEECVINTLRLLFYKY